VEQHRDMQFFYFSQSIPSLASKRIGAGSAFFLQQKK
jgi:hypothetical protein